MNCNFVRQFYVVLSSVSIIPTCLSVVCSLLPLVCVQLWHTPVLLKGHRYDLPLQTTGQPAITTKDCQENAGQANLRDYMNRKFCNYNNWEWFTFLNWPWNHKRHRPGGLVPCFLRWGRVATCLQPTLWTVNAMKVMEGMSHGFTNFHSRH